MKSIPQILSVFLIVMFSCNTDSAVKPIKSEKTSPKSEVPKKKIAEQFSSTDSKLVSEKVDIESPKEDLNNQVSETTAKKQDVTPAAVKPNVPAVITPKVKKPKQIVRSAEIEFEEYLFDFGEIMQGDKIDHKFTFKNTGNAPLTITKADATCGCATPSIPFMDIMPGEVGYIGVSFNSVGKEGEESPQVTIFSNAGKNPNLVLKLKGYVKVPGEEEEKSESADSLKTTEKDTIKVEGSN